MGQALPQQVKSRKKLFSNSGRSDEDCAVSGFCVSGAFWAGSLKDTRTAVSVAAS